MTEPSNTGRIGIVFQNLNEIFTKTEIIASERRIARTISARTTDVRNITGAILDELQSRIY